MTGIPPNSLFSSFAFIGFLLAAIPLPWHVQSWNTGSSMFMLWTSLGCLILFVNSIVWNDNVINSAPVWCDISIHYLIGASVGIPASSLCIAHRAYCMTKLATISVDKAQRRREMIVDVLIGISFPCVVMALGYVVQTNRFIIFEQIGCYPSMDNTPLAYTLILMWPLILGLISLVYALLTFRRAKFLRKELLKKLRYSGCFVSTGHYWRLMAMCSVEIIFTVPLSLYVIISDATVLGPVVPYVSWTFVHSDFSEIPQYPVAIWQTTPSMVLMLESQRSMFVLCAFVIFAIFGWGREVRGFYCLAFWSVSRHFGYPRPSTSFTTPTRQRRFGCAGNLTLFAHDNQGHLSMPVQARVKRESFRALSPFEAPSSLDSLTPSSRPSVDTGSTETQPGLPAQSISRHHAHVSWGSVLAIPEPALVRDRLPSDVSQLV